MTPYEFLLEQEAARTALNLSARERAELLIEFHRMASDPAQEPDAFLRIDGKRELSIRKYR